MVLVVKIDFPNLYFDLIRTLLHYFDLISTLTNLMKITEN